MGVIGDFLFGRQETIEEKADKVGFEVKPTETGYTVKGTDAYDQPATWSLDPFATRCLLDHVHSNNIGDQYLQEHYGLNPGDTTGDANRDCEIKHEVRDHSLQALEDETKPGWKRLLGL